MSAPEMQSGSSETPTYPSIHEAQIEVFTLVLSVDGLLLPNLVTCCHEVVRHDPMITSLLLLLSAISNAQGC